MIRTVKKEDLQRVFELNEKFVPRVGRENLQWFETYFERADSFLVYEDENKIVQGYAVCMLPSCDYQSMNFLWFKERYDHFLYLDRIAIDNSLQGKGIGKLFYQKLKADWQSKVERITCEVNIRPPNAQSYEFHKKIGFKEVGQQETKGGTIRVAMLVWEINRD